MKTRHQVHNLIILDESGSMFSIKKQIINGFNEVVQTVKGVEEQFPEQEHFISLVSFNGLGITEHLFMAPVNKLQEINEYMYRPDASTPLYDAMGFGISKLENFLGEGSNCNVLVTILTDGEENSSREYSAKSIKMKVEALQNKGWTFTYTGTEHDVYRAAKNLSINNVMEFSKSDSSMKNMFEKERAARILYSNKIRTGKNTDKDFY